MILFIPHFVDSHYVSFYKDNNCNELLSTLFIDGNEYCQKTVANSYIFKQCDKQFILQIHTRSKFCYYDYLFLEGKSDECLSLTNGSAYVICNSEDYSLNFDYFYFFLLYNLCGIALYTLRIFILLI
jgi:hypothetical protein